MKWNIFGNSVQGASHIRTKIECQDSCKKKKLHDGSVIMAVADGHGSKSCPFSKTGSSIAVKVFCTVMSSYLCKYKDDYESLISFLNREGDTKVAQAIDSEWKIRVEKNHRKNKREMPTTDSGEINKPLLYSQYGTTLLGLVLTAEFLFAFQIGDGDILFVSKEKIEPVIMGDKILGVETHSLSKVHSWKKAITTIRRISIDEQHSSMFMLSSDGFANSYRNETEFYKTCTEYLEMIDQYGTKEVNKNLKTWLSETSEMGCGDDITVLIAYQNTANENQQKVQEK